MDKPLNIRAALSPENVRSRGEGPLYIRLRRALEELFTNRLLDQGHALPTERDIADMTGLSRVTVRKAVDDLVKSGQLVRRRGSGTFVASQIGRVEQPLSKLTSFTEDMERRGLRTRSVWLNRGVYTPSPDETMVLGLSIDDRVARFERLRIAADTPLAIERAAIVSEYLPDPETVTNSLYEALGQRRARPFRATQRISARNVDDDADAKLLDISVGDAVLQIERVSYLSSGRAIEFTRSIYRGDAYDFVAELRIQDS